MKAHLKNSYLESLKLLQDFVSKEKNIEITEQISKDLASCFSTGGKALIAGNGGSTCDSMHFAEEFTGRYRKNRRPLPAISLSDASHITCVANDFGFDEIFARGVEAFGKPGDFFLAISTSGNSPNIIKAVKKAQELGLKTVGLLGKDGGVLKGVCDYEFIIPAVTSDRIQEIHMTILHIIIEGVERIIFPENYEE